MRRAVVIYNPVAGSGLAQELATRAVERLGAVGWEAEPMPTEGPGDATRLARSVRDRIDLLVVCGGDGSLREAILGLGPASRRVATAVLPCGNANVVARELEVPLDPNGALDLLERGLPTRFDLGYANGELFLAMVGIGWDAYTVRILDRLRATSVGRFWYRLWADAVYFASGIAALFAWPPCRFGIELDGRPLARRFCAAVIANVRCYGKGWAVVPDADFQSGRLHFQARKRFGVPFLVWQLLAAMRRRRVPRFISEHDCGEHVRITAVRGVPVQVDGDYKGLFTELTVTVDPGAASILAPPREVAAAPLRKTGEL